MSNSCGAETRANELLTSLVGGKEFTLPQVDLHDTAYALPSGPALDAPERLENADLTTRKVGGEGAFDHLMDGVAAQLRKEFEANRISGAEYTRAFVEVASTAMQTAVQYLLGRDQAYWGAVTAQLQSRRAEIDLVTARVDLATAKATLQTRTFEAANAEAQYALTKMQIVTEDARVCQVREETRLAAAQAEQAEFTNQHLMPLQRTAAEEGIELTRAQTDQARGQVEQLQAQTAQLVWTTANLLPAQKRATDEQVEQVRAQTLDTRSDGLPVRGSVGKQKDLYEQQIVSYKRDAEVKAAKLFLDPFSLRLSDDAGIVGPNALTNASLEGILERIRTNNELVSR